MCGIIGVFNSSNSVELVKRGAKAIEYRGRDGFLMTNGKETGTGVAETGCALGHLLHSVVGFVHQPLGNSFAANCEIYNWKELAKIHKLEAKNDAELLFLMVRRFGLKALDELDGDYAFAFWDKEKVWIARDIIGVKPLWYTFNGSFTVASERKALVAMGFKDARELNPREIICYDIKKKKMTIKKRQFFACKESALPKNKIKEKINTLLKDAIRKRLCDRNVGLLFSGGIDSTYIAAVLQQLGVDFTCYTTVIDDDRLKEPKDLTYAIRVANEMGLKHKIIRIKCSEIPALLSITAPLIEDSNAVKNSVALTFYPACAEAKKDGCKVIFSGLGAEEIFAGYQRHRKSADVNRECYSGLLKVYERDLYRDDVVAMYNSLELRVPFLDSELIRFALSIPAKYKLADGVDKAIFREAALDAGVTNTVVYRKKKAAQYGSNVLKAVERNAREAGFKLKSKYIRQFYKQDNLKLCALVSTGKDSLYAAYVMRQQNYDITCMATIDSANTSSYMFHTPNIHLAKLQAKAMNVPIIYIKTAGEKEEELRELKKALSLARTKYKVDGIVSGALDSAYQRDRIEQVAEELGLKLFSPLWHQNEETYLAKLVADGFVFIISAIAAEGLDRSWLGGVIDNAEARRLLDTCRKYRLHPAGEGGEYETFVLDCPLFKRPIKIIKSRIVEEDKNTAQLIIEKAELKS